MSPAKNTSNKPEKDTAPSKPIEPAPQVPANSDLSAQVSATPKNHDDTDVEAALARETHDGKGKEEVPESDFDSFATEGVENKPSATDLAREVLEGHWGYNRRRAMHNLTANGHDASAVDEELQKLIDSGAPSTLVD